ncbi:hypothetical protein EsH8_II_000555 [Colletotrichum jinshuiense]
MEFFEYEPLDLEGHSFRLLMLHQAEAGEITCDIFHANLEPGSVIPYEALSYAWGGIDLSESITVNGKTLQVTKNLYSALEYLRHSENRILWIDAICIDQNNLRERGHQVGQMGDIYRQAEQVVVWLGPSTYETKILMESLNKLQREWSRQAKNEQEDMAWMEVRWLSIQQSKDYDYAALLDIQRRGLASLLNQAWFTRVWIVQEVANARAAVICCGKWSLRARIFVAAPELLGVEPNPQCQAVLDLMPTPSRKGDALKKDLHTLLTDFRGSRATDPRDMVYALLGIASDVQQSGALVPDYTKSEEQLIRDVVALVFFGKELSHTLGEYSKMQQFLAAMPELKDTAVKYLQSKIDDRIKQVEEMVRRMPYTSQTQRALITIGYYQRDVRDIYHCFLRLEDPDLATTKGCFDQISSWCDMSMALLSAELDQTDLKLTTKISHLLHGGKSFNDPDVRNMLLEWAGDRTIPVTQAGFEDIVLKYDTAVVTAIVDRRDEHFWITPDLINAAEGNRQHGWQIMAFLLTWKEGNVRVEPAGVIWLLASAEAELVTLLQNRLSDRLVIKPDVVTSTMSRIMFDRKWDGQNRRQIERRTKSALRKWHMEGLIKCPRRKGNQTPSS